MKEDSKRPRRQLILDTFSDAIADFMYYARKEDEQLPRGAIEEAISAGEISVDDLVVVLRKEIKV